MRTVDFVAVLRAGCSLAGEVAFEDHGAVEDVPAEREVEELAFVGLKSDRLHFGEFVYCGEDR